MLHLRQKANALKNLPGSQITNTLKDLPRSQITNTLKIFLDLK